MAVRLNKYLADSGAASRRKAEELILEGRVSVNNKTVVDLAFKVDTEKDVVDLDGEIIKPKRHIYFLMNKPKGVVTTTSDDKKRNTVLDGIKTKEKVYPVGRLDYNTTGVLFLTNDGDFSYFLTHPKNKVPRVYEVKLDKPLQEKDVESLLKGVFIQGVRGNFEKVTFPKKKDHTFAEVTGLEGRNHFVKNMFGTLGFTVTSLNRKSYAGIEADIPFGTYRAMRLIEIEQIIKRYGK